MFFKTIPPINMMYTTVDHKTIEVWWLTNMKLQIFEVVAVVLLLLLLSFDDLFPQVHILDYFWARCLSKYTYLSITYQCRYMALKCFLRHRKILNFEMYMFGRTLKMYRKSMSITSTK